MENRKVALVTGGAKGIGRSISKRLGKDGYNVCINYRTSPAKAEELKKEIEEFGVEAFCVYADMSSLKDIRAMYDACLEHYGRIDLVVNNAGISSEVYFLDATEEDFDKMTAIDWKGLFFSSQFAAKSMIERNIKGVIVNISSNQTEGCWPRATIYAPTKAAVSKFTKNAGMELTLKGIRMVAVAPGYTNVGWPEGDIRLEAAARLPLRRFASTEEIASLVSYVASEDAAYMVGNTVFMDGGATLPVVAANDFV